MATVSCSAAITNVIMAEMAKNPLIFAYQWGMPSKAMVTAYGWDHALYSSINEQNEVGAAIGAAMVGCKPIVNLSMSDFAIEATQQIVNQAAKPVFETGYKAKVGIILRASYGAMGGNSVMHSNCYYNWFANQPGLLVAVPSTPYDFTGLYRTALRSIDDPVFIFEGPGMGNTGDVPDADYTIPFGQGNVVQAGTDVTIAAIGPFWVAEALAVAATMAKSGISVEVWDPRTLNPLDKAGLIASVNKTGALVVVDQAPQTFGTAGEFLASVAEATKPIPPMARVTTMDLPIGFAPELEAYVLPTQAKIAAAVTAVLAKKSGSATAPPPAK